LLPSSKTFPISPPLRMYFQGEKSISNFPFMVLYPSIPCSFLAQPKADRTQGRRTKNGKTKTYGHSKNVRPVTAFQVRRKDGERA
jgi:hypothetical protein